MKNEVQRISSVLFDGLGEEEFRSYERLLDQIFYVWGFGGEGAKLGLLDNFTKAIWFWLWV